MTDLKTENWISLAGNAPGWLALVVAIVSAIFSYKSYRLSKNREGRAVASLDLYLADCYTQVTAGKTIFYFDVVATNRSDTANSICEVELILKFVQPDGVELSRRLRPVNTAVGSAALLEVGLRLNPWEAKRGCCEFELQTSEKASFHRIPAVRLEVADSTGAAYHVSSEVISERPL